MCVHTCVRAAECAYAYVCVLEGDLCVSLLNRLPNKYIVYAALCIHNVNACIHVRAIIYSYDCRFAVVSLKRG